jgi:non-lysosomal glucosylceramidase
VTDWPVLRTYEQDSLARIALPLGGIGTGTISLGGRGDLRDWEITNRPGKGFAPDPGFFAIHLAQEGKPGVTRALQGPLDSALYEGPTGSRTPGHGLPRFRAARFEAAYPFGQVLLSDESVPVTVRLQAFNPLIPADSDRSGIPVGILRYVISNTSDEPVTATVCGSVRNVIGTDGSGGDIAGNINTFRADPTIAGVVLATERADATAERDGTIALATVDTDDVSCREAWVEGGWGRPLLDFWDDLSADGALDPRQSADPAPVASLASRIRLEPGQTRPVTFLIGWHFPHRRAWIHGHASYDDYTDDIVGNHYATLYRDAWDVVARTAADLPALERDTAAFVGAFLASDLPPSVQEAALFNLSTLRTQTGFRTADGIFFGWEGCHDRTGSCFGSCTHVWNYEPATAHLFGDLARSMRQVEFGHATDKTGLMSFRVGLPLADRAQEWRLAAADGQLGCIVKLHREWQLSGDHNLLRSLWPAAKAALGFAWIPGGWDADRDGVMEGVQHNTMDVEYYGPNPQMQGWYLAALRAGEEMARGIGDDDFAALCRKLFDSGSAWTDQHLFNGRYYEHDVRPVANPAEVAAGLRHAEMGAQDTASPDLQLANGCLVDQLVGQVLAHIGGLGHVLDPGHVRTTLQNIRTYNRRTDFDSHFNPMRSYALGAEAALLMCSYPDGNRPERPFPYYAEVMTGMEYTAAVGMIYEGLVDEGVATIADVRERYDGLRRNPFNEAECGHHYARAMASWGAVLALTGFGYRAAEGILRLRHRPGAVDFFSTGDGWGLARQSEHGVDIDLIGGSLRIDAVELVGFGVLPVVCAGRHDAPAHLSCTR